VPAAGRFEGLRRPYLPQTGRRVVAGCRRLGRTIPRWFAVLMSFYGPGDLRPVRFLVAVRDGQSSGSAPLGRAWR
jgi:hypothetical protein